MLALISGNGSLPAAVARAQASMPLICALAGHAPDDLTADLVFRIEHFGSFLKDLTARGISEVCLCGAIERPVIDPARIDNETLPLAPTLAGAVAQGEDSALRAVVGIIEDSGFTVRGAHEIAPDLLPAAGSRTKVSPYEDISSQLDTARAVLHEQGRADVGQACVVRAGAVIAREDARGTDAMLTDLAGAATSGGFLFKAPKPDQDRRVDLPTIGAETALGAARAGLDGIVIEAGGVMVLDLPQVRRILEDAGMYLWVR
jgi:UDP-2,3-diacylglucosamine hydrolase